MDELLKKLHELVILILNLLEKLLQEAPSL